jgi:hypothetical protein
VTALTRELQRRLCTALPAVAAHMIEVYVATMTAPPPEEDGAARGAAPGREAGKEAAGRHAAGKTLLGHIEAALKLLRWAESELAGAGGASPAAAERRYSDAEVDRLVQEARVAVARVAPGS